MRIEFETHSDGEITFIMEVIYNENNAAVRRMECVGWYFGKEDDELTEYYKYKGNIALFN